jgi:hypothetical protein
MELLGYGYEVGIFDLIEFGFIGLIGTKLLIVALFSSHFIIKNSFWICLRFGLDYGILGLVYC